MGNTMMQVVVGLHVL